MDASGTRVLFPQIGFTTFDLVQLYRALSPVLLPHLWARPISFRRFPATIDDESYWEKDAPGFTPKWVGTVAIPRRSDEPDLHYILVEDQRTLEWAASVGCIEIHPFLHTYRDLNCPTSIVFDLDPGEGAGLARCCETALLIRAFLKRSGLETFVKLSGAKGMQVYLPLNTPITYAATRMFARRVAERLADQRPALITARSSNFVRADRVLIDWSQNSPHKSNVAVYSVRVTSERPTLSMPLTWREVEDVLLNSHAHSLRFEPEAALARIREVGDLFRPMLSLQQRLPQKLLRDWGIVAGRANLVSLQKPTAASETMTRSSGQGGRRSFIVYRDSARDSHFRLGLHLAGDFRFWNLRQIPSAHGGSSTTAVESEDSSAVTAVLDQGTFEVIEGSYKSGELRLFFSGKKLEGEWTLARSKGEWTFTKLSGAEMDCGRKAEDMVGPISANNAGPSTAMARVAPLEHKSSKLPQGQPRFFKPMEADEVDRPEELPTDRSQWMYEIKWDGYRAIAVKKDGAVRIFGRSGKPLENCRHEHLDKALAESKFGDGVLDGEIVAFADGVASFQTLQNSMRNNAPVVFVVFDLLNYGGRDLTGLSYVERREFLSTRQHLLPAFFQVSEPIDANVFDLLKTFEQKKIEGVVAKRRDAYYRPGKTSHGWVKYWIGELGEFVIGGYMPGKDRYFEALAVGEYRDGRLLYREQIRHGFSPTDKQIILETLKRYEIEGCPFANLPQKKRRGSVDEIRMEQYVWVKPIFHCLMRYKERTAAGEIREHGKFVKLLDKEAA